MDLSSRIFVAGHRGLVGAAIVRRLQAAGYQNLVTASRSQVDLRDAIAVDRFFAEYQPDYVFLAAAKVGGIYANDIYPADFIRDNLQIQTNVIDAAYRQGCQKLLFLGSTCIYPKFAPQPMPESCLLTGELEPTNEWYAIAKIAGIKLCQAYRKQYGFNAISLMPTNLYGPEDNFHPENSHVLPALIRRFLEAKEANQAEVVCWGTGSPRREFLYVDDLADACLFLMQTYNEPEIVNVGVGHDISIRELAELVAQTVGYGGAIAWDSSKPDGTPRKLVDVQRLTQLGWTAQTSLELGLRQTLDWFLAHRLQEARL
ncbi:GDP-L-fucose synthase [Synechococcus elongatus]|uniref:GDP-L-fucose synthase n=2 Tax=Synechococcus elongatus TaxID=32046 RepID=Q31MI9_SYNE7|nr:GDP-L-fucose synthase [Synechococcus elongatus]ABB57730.1 GDP-fucose synthetase NAD dependent epimerase/dehydratase [Synechococcus elongatus PCC 7942 = FACHB-805]AJD57781.1 GDP-L-fucose synthase [Synechococcus elongatus UTEX 2973]MBD2586445.1 GDP-L-fucose synthase [Synechococcus elongatus FACHB-242]MBD2687519.1 GDP-L-fucose synthase [Synechococcus elongatus FACHB-1061]MBD2706772.1 GDP-L-fucose synthase [Synechococcus elongatus PCC 7942 = FACHB-805]